MSLNIVRPVVALLIAFSVAFLPAMADAPVATNRKAIPVGTTVFVQMETLIDSADPQEGDEFSVRTKTDISCDAVVFFPKGSVIKGRFYAENDPKSSSGEKTIAFKFDCISGFDKAQTAIAADLCPKNGFLEVRKPLCISKIAVDDFPLSELNDRMAAMRIYYESPAETERRSPGSYPKYALPQRLNRKFKLAPGDVFKISLSQPLSTLFSLNPKYPAQ
jgi:hypothetical protein